MAVSPAAGQPGFSVLNAPPAAAPAGLAGAVVAAVGEPWAAYVNPAGLARLDRPAAALQGAAGFDDVLHEGFLWARPGRRGVWAATAGVTSVSGLTRTVYDPALPDHFSTAGSIRAGDLYGGVSYGSAYSPDGAWGAGVKAVREDLDRRAAATVLFDAGMVRQLDEDLRAGLALRNAGPAGRFSSEKVSPPTRIQAGLHYSSVGWAAWEADVFRAFGGPGEAALGAAFNKDGVYIFRLGYRHRFRTNRLGARGNASAGLGFQGEAFSVDYAFQPFGDLGDVHRMSLTWRWGKTI